ncbi:MAG: hypothetical protein QME48_04745 [bacterium]|uniref:Tetratricopeptide repeat protein n=2 Tax=Bacteria candidate phyla TaxID=1783234 RepID=A0A348MK19_UNCW3|nr:MAG: Putative efflux ABC transporter accessory factor PilG [candidate division TA06 bacterium 32_111]KUK87221.1 MAG: Putative efflux ABC transporter accessory factor PilG [candidate division TA06 bacterium 34_109]MDI6700521.1 hypothetical protein [bacterium]HAF07395.1 hypothetical protein [candidate division WOR-3 bacterium]HCP16196.1 hypothetical protein [candidate division WOR-3 bacterium]
MKKFFYIIFVLISVLIFANILQNLPENIKKFENELLYFPSGKLIREISLDFKTTLTNLMWFEAVQYYGQHMLTDRNLKFLNKLFDVITDLDSNFLQCYTFGGTVVTYDQKRPDLGLSLLDKGMINLPDVWQIPFVKGFLYYIYLNDYEKAYRWFLFSSTKKNSPYFCKTFAAASKKKEGDYITAVKLWSEIYKGTDNRFQKESAKKNIIFILNESFNKIAKKSGDTKVKSIKGELKKLAFLPFGIDVKIYEDSVVVKEK